MSRAAETVDIAANVARIRERIARAAAGAGRNADEIRLVAAAKTVDAARVAEAIAAGVTDIGENYVQEAAAKRDQVGGSARWHLIGHLQRNKVASAAKIFDNIQTVDSPRLAQSIAARARALGRTLEVLLQVNTSGESSKSGIAPDRLEELFEAVAPLQGIRVQGLMTIGAMHADPETGRPEFRLLVGLAGRLERLGAEMRWLSMGMSHDFEVAIEEGASLVRVGTGVFGRRPQ
jgi:pyridoxal phosphate enzyme (YggS family)